MHLNFLKNMGILEFLLLFFLIFPTVHSQNICTSSLCGKIQINYPFKLQVQEPGNNCTYINLTCSNNQGIAILNLPFSGDFNVTDIDYYENRINLNDPSNCLLGRLLNNSMNLSYSPFTAPFYEKYTFYTCPANADQVRFYAPPIGCLTNATNATIATPLGSPEEFEYYGCEIIGSSLFPVMYQGQYDYQGIYDLSLNWDVSDCKDCDPQPPPPPPPPQDTGINLKSPLFILSFFLLVLLLISSCGPLIKGLSLRNEFNASADHNSTTNAALSRAAILTILPQATLQRGQVTMGLDDSKIKSYTELVVVGENQSISGQGDSSCAICLEAYNPQEKVRSIAKCAHFFHNDCIVLWLKRNSTCPVCRTSLSDVNV